MENEIEVFDKFLVIKNLKKTIPRETILKIFLSTEKHVTIEEFHDIIKAHDPMIGFSTIYRTMKLLCECHLAREIHLGDKKTRYEHYYDHAHHDHLVCTECGNTIEFLSNELEFLQEKISKKFSFTSQNHRLVIYGVCKDCNNEIRKSKRYDN